MEQVQKDKKSQSSSNGSYRFDIFRGKIDAAGKIEKIRSLGTASLLPGTKTYHIRLRTFLNDDFFMLPEDKDRSRSDYAILTREPSLKPGRKYYWHRIGEGIILGGENLGVMKMDWDMLGGDDIFMSLHPFARPIEDREDVGDLDPSNFPQSA